MFDNYNSKVTTSDDPEHTTRTKKKSLRLAVKETYAEYCSNTSIHGVQYLKQERPWIEKCFWGLVLLVSIIFCTISIEEIYEKWNDTPVIVSFSETSTDISQIPFPAITICSETKRPKDEEGPSFADLLMNLVTEGESFNPNITSDKLEEFLTLLHICDDDYGNIPPLIHPQIDYIEILNKMSPDFYNNLFGCKWSSRHHTACDSMFTKTYTEEGLCYTFNGLNGTDLYREDTVQYKEMGVEGLVNNTIMPNRSLSWSMQQGYAPNSDFRTYPARVLRSGSKAGVNVLLNNWKRDIDYGCRGITQGFKLLLHSPDDVPMLSKQFVRIPPAKEVLISVKPNVMETSEGIARYTPQKRKCYLEGERHLRFFKIYSQQNCELECLTNYTLSKCGCVKFSMPRTYDTPVCGAGQIQCYMPAEDELMLQHFSHGLTKCNCMPACTTMTYNIETSQGNLDIENFFKSLFGIDFQSDLKTSPDMSSVSIYFKDNEFMSSKRSQLYGFYEFVANCGGICGLFMGFSVLSVIEVLYHLTLRLWSNKNSQK